MSDDIRYQIHLKRLNQIKQRPNKYPVYNINTKGKNSPSPKKMKIDKLLSEIKTNRINISLVKKGFEKKKPVNYEDDKYIYEREIENIQKKLINQLISNNNDLQNQVQILKQNNYYYYK